MNHPTRVMSWIVGAATLIGCAGEPTVHIQDARQAVAAAQSAGIAERSALARSYQTAQDLAMSLQDAADRVSREGSSGREKMKYETAALVARAKIEYEAVTRMLEQAHRGQGTRADLVSLKTDTHSMESMVRNMDSAFRARDYMRAKFSAEAVLLSIERMRVEIRHTQTASWESGRT